MLSSGRPRREKTMRPAMPFAGAFMLALALAGQARSAEPFSTSDECQGSWINAKMIKQRDADRALRETLTQSAVNATGRLGEAGAFSHTPTHGIALPKQLNSLRGDWNAVGRSGALETLQAAMNSAAETAAPQALPTLRVAISEV